MKGGTDLSCFDIKTLTNLVSTEAPDYDTENELAYEFGWQNKKGLTV
jgi:hypothetical protein